MGSLLLALAVASGCSLIAGSSEDPAPAPVTPPAEIPVPPIAASTAPSAPLASNGTGPHAGRPATRIARVTIESTPPTTRVVIELDGVAEPEVSLLVNQRLVVDVPGTTCESLPRVVESAGDPLVERVRTGQHAAPAVKSRIVIDLRERADFTVRRQDDRIVVLLAPATPGRAAAAADTANVILGAEPSGGRASAPPPDAAPAAMPSPDPTAAPQVEATPAIVAEAIATPAAATPAPDGTPEASPAATVSAPLEPAAPPLATPADDGTPAIPMIEATRSGKRISIDFTETDVRTVVDLIASAGGYRAIFTPEVAGTVSITLVDRPWEDALATVLRAQRLREVRHEDVMLVSPVPREANGARRSSP